MADYVYPTATVGKTACAVLYDILLKSTKTDMSGDDMTAFDYLHRSVKATYPCPECIMNDIDRHLSRVSKTQGDPSREKPVEMRRNGVFDAASILATSLEKLMEAPAFASHQMPTNTLSGLLPDGQEYHKLIASFAI